MDASTEPDTPEPTAPAPATRAAPVAEEPAPTSCLNCGAKLVGAYCHGCGQRGLVRRLGAREIGAEAWSQITDLDRGFAKTFVGLTLRPGSTVQQFLDGKRAAFTGPLRYYLLLVAAWLVAPTLIGLDLPTFVESEMEPAWRALGVGWDSPWRDRYAAMVVHRRYVNLLLVPILAASLSALFRAPPRHTFAENVAFSLYVTGHAMVLSIFSLIFQRLELDWVVVTVSVIANGYIWWAATQYTQQAWWKVGLLFMAALTALSCSLGCALGAVLGVAEAIGG